MDAENWLSEFSCNDYSFTPELYSPRTGRECIKDWRAGLFGKESQTHRNGKSCGKNIDSCFRLHFAAFTSASRLGQRRPMFCTGNPESQGGGGWMKTTLNRGSHGSLYHLRLEWAADAALGRLACPSWSVHLVLTAIVPQSPPGTAIVGCV